MLPQLLEISRPGVENSTYKPSAPRSRTIRRDVGIADCFEYLLTEAELVDGNLCVPERKVCFVPSKRVIDGAVEAAQEFRLVFCNQVDEIGIERFLLSERLRFAHCLLRKGGVAAPADAIDRSHAPASLSILRRSTGSNSLPSTTGDAAPV